MISKQKQFSVFIWVYILIIVFLFWHTGINSLVPTIAINWMNVPTLLTPSQQKTVKQ